MFQADYENLKLKIYNTHTKIQNAIYSHRTRKDQNQNRPETIARQTQIQPEWQAAWVLGRHQCTIPSFTSTTSGSSPRVLDAQCLGERRIKPFPDEKEL